MGFIDWINQTVAPALGKAVGWLDQNVVKPVGSFAENAAGTLLGDGAKNAVHQFGDAVHQGAGFLQNGLNNGKWDLNAAKNAIAQGAGALGNIGGQVAGAVANPEATLARVAGNVYNKLVPQNVRQNQQVQTAMSNPKVQQGLNQLKRRAGEGIKSIAKRVKT
jgi:hypothetical protein